jgi:putative spermidine/putrescine transport system permease protein
MESNTPLSRALHLGWLGLVGLLYLFLLAPIIVVLISSFDTRPYLAFPPASYSWGSYVLLFHNTTFIKAFLVSLGVGSLASLLSLCCGVPAALALVRHSFKGRSFFNWLFLSPLLAPHIVLGLAILLIMSPLHLLDTYTGIVLAHLGITVPYIIRTVSISLQSVDIRVEEAARVHGASILATFFKVTLPLIVRGIAAGGIIAFLISFDEAVIALFIAGSRVSTLPVEIYHYIEYRTDPQVAALSVVLIAISILLVFFVERMLGLRKALNH